MPVKKSSPVFPFANALTVCYVFAVHVAVFSVFKLVFMLYNWQADWTVGDVWPVVWHGLPLDVSTAGYLTAVPLLFALLGAWLRIPQAFSRIFFLIYFALTALLLSVILCVDCVLYPYWEFKLDATVFNYLDKPGDALASVPWHFVVVGVLAILFVAIDLFWLLRRVRFSHQPKHRWAQTLVLVLLGGGLFLGIRGGVGKATMNIGRVYFSQNQFLNHAAVNPAFSLLSSSLKAERFDRMYRYYSADELKPLASALRLPATTSSPTDSLLTIQRPHVVLVIVEGFSSVFISALQGEEGVTPEFNRLAKEGVLFTHCHANSFRTDRGVLSLLSGYPAFPTVSVMKMPQKSRTLPSLARSLGEAGYRTEFLYGGDVNFTNMKSYLLSTGYQTVLGDEHFPAEARSTHAWGVTDGSAFDTLSQRLQTLAPDAPQFTTFLTLASHEPWVVPYQRIPDNEIANAMAYTDHCIGRFVDGLRQTPQWERTLLIFVADHGVTYGGLTEADERRSRIPMLWTGGAVRGAKTVDKLCSQTDLAATLLSQLGLDSTPFTFSHDVLGADYDNPYAVHTFSGGLAYIDSTGYTVHDLNTQQNLTDQPTPSNRRLQLGKAYLQLAIDDLNQR